MQTTDTPKPRNYKGAFILVSVILAGSWLGGYLLAADVTAKDAAFAEKTAQLLKFSSLVDGDMTEFVCTHDLGIAKEDYDFASPQIAMNNGKYDVVLHCYLKDGSSQSVTIKQDVNIDDYAVEYLMK